MSIVDNYLPVYSPSKGQGVGEMKLTIALGTPG